MIGHSRSSIVPRRKDVVSQGKTIGQLPIVSIICHSFNHEHYIEGTLEAMTSQLTDFPFEIIVHDDASSDRSQEIIREVSEKQHSQRIVPILQEQNQFSKGRRPPRFTFPRARGEFIALCEGDDYWTSPDKLQRQVDAMRQHPEIDLCVHPAMRLSMRTEKQKKGFDHGPTERIVPPETVIARHNQFAPTASMLMRAKAAQNLPDWFFTEPDLPVGDCFIEAILGRKGVLYLPETMSVYRRDVPGSYTQRFRMGSSQELDKSLKKMIHFTKKLYGIKEIPDSALEQRLSYVRLNYALQFLAIGDLERFRKIGRDVHLKRHLALRTILGAMRRSRLAFFIGRHGFLQYRRING